MMIAPLAEVPVDPLIAALPKADLHIHQEWSPRLDRVLARRAGQASYNWEAWARRLMTETPPGIARLRLLSRVFPAPVEADAAPENFIARVEDLLEEAAADGAVYIEPRFGNVDVLRPGFMDLFREAERRVQRRYPTLCAEAVVPLLLWLDPDQLERIFTRCLELAPAGLGGIDMLYEPYDTEVNWDLACRLGERAAAVGLGVTAHAGEFSSANIAAALRVPGLTRLGHATYAGYDDHLLDLMAQRGVAVECALTCNVILGAVPSYEAHPIRRFADWGIPITLATDDPVQLCTTIGREYAIAHALGFSPDDLLAITRNAVRASFAPYLTLLDE